MNGVKVTTTVVGAIQVGQNPRHMCLTVGVCLVARVSTGSAVQCSSAAVQQIRVGALSPMPSCLIRGHPSGSRQRTPTAHWGLKSRRVVGGPFGSDSRYTANTFQFFEKHNFWSRLEGGKGPTLANLALFILIWPIFDPPIWANQFWIWCSWGRRRERGEEG